MIDVEILNAFSVKILMNSTGKVSKRSKERNRRKKKKRKNNVQYSDSIQFSFYFIIKITYIRLCI